MIITEETNKVRLTNQELEPRAAAVFRDGVRKNFAFLKQTNRLDDLYAKGIPLAEERGFLLPVCELHAGDEALIETLARWRAENAFAYPSQFPVTVESTRSWLRSRLLDVEDRMLFLVVDTYGRVVGHLGFANALNDQGTMEIDNVVRGVKDSGPGIMSAALNALIKWAEDVIAPRSIFLRVFSDNRHAIAFYRRLGFQDGELLPLQRHIEGDSVHFRPLVDEGVEPDKYFLRMVYAPSREWDGTETILTAGPSISGREASYALDAARHGWNRQWNKYIVGFERAFAEYVGVEHTLSTSSCTGALHLALLTLDIGPGDEVIVPDITWVATANAVRYVGATPIFADVEPNSWCLDPYSFESLITERTKAVMPVHLYGHPARMDEIVRIAREHGIFIVEDAAPAIGAEFRGRRVGTFGDFAAFSFQGAKLVVTGEGGMLVTDNDELFRKARSLWDQGRDPDRTFWINDTGWKYKMSNIQAAIGLAQIERVDQLIEAKRRVFGWYAEGLSDLPHVQLNVEQPWARSIYWMSSILLHEDARITRDRLRTELAKRNVDTRPIFPAISQYPIWDRPQPPQPIARRVGDQGINLPSGVLLTSEQVGYVCRSIRQILEGVEA